MRHKDQRIAHLRSVPMFQTCTDKELLEIGRLAEQVDVPAGEVLEISQREFWSLLRDVPALPLKLLHGMARRLHQEPVPA